MLGWLEDASRSRLSNLYVQSVRRSPLKRHLAPMRAAGGECLPRAHETLLKVSMVPPLMAAAWEARAYPSS